MLDQVKSGASARIATTARIAGTPSQRPGDGASGPVIAPSRRINALTGVSAADADRNGGGHEARPDAGGENPRPDDRPVKPTQADKLAATLKEPGAPHSDLKTAFAALPPGALVRKAGAVPEVLKELVREARELARETDPGAGPAAPAPAPVGLPQAEAGHAKPLASHSRAVARYTRIEQGGEDSRDMPLGAIVSAKL